MTRYFQEQDRSQATVRNPVVYLYRLVHGRWVLVHTYRGHLSNAQAAADYYGSHVGEDWFYTSANDFWQVAELSAGGHATYQIPGFPEDARLNEEDEEFWAEADAELGRA